MYATPAQELLDRRCSSLHYTGPVFQSTIDAQEVILEILKLNVHHDQMLRFSPVLVIICQTPGLGFSAPG